MAPISKTLALAGALFAVSASAAPMQKRENVVVWETVTDVEWTTVDVTTTINVNGHNSPLTTPAVVKTTATAVPIAQPQPTQEPADNTPVNPPVAPSPTPVPPPPPQQPTLRPEPSPRSTTEQAPPAAPTVAPPPPPQQPSPTAPSTPSSTGGSGSGGGNYNGACSEDSPCVGDVTFYDTATSASAPGSCGGTSDGHTENVLALPHGIMKDSDCGKTVTIKHNGKTSTGTVVDKCMGCDSNSIDLSRHFFGELASLGEGRLSGVKWWID